MSERNTTSQILKKRARRSQGSLFSRIVRWFFGMLLLLIFTGVLAVVGVYFYLSEDLPKISSLKDYHPPEITTV